MGRFDKGVSYYTSGTLVVNFPEDDVKCKWCPLMGTEMASGRVYCRRTGELLIAPDAMIGHNCPLNFRNEEEIDGGEYVAV